jgi:2-methylisocitrate lyase-like PEP mutase family enzyme
VTPSSVLRARLASTGDPLLLPGAANALTARILEEAGFDAVYLSGAGVANTFLGVPDLGLVTLTEMVEHLSAIRDAVGLPIVVDADTGFGNALNVARTVRLLERSGASGIQIEDQVAPKRCGHFDGKGVIETSEMVGKIRAALDARVDDDLVLIARTDARAGHGLDAACDRAARYLEAGADVVFVEAPLDRREMATIVETVPGLHMANMVEGGRTPVLPLDELAGLGYALVLYANTVMRAAITGMQRAAAHLAQRGDSHGLEELMASWSERQRLVRKDHFDVLSEEYSS